MDNKDHFTNITISKLICVYDSYSEKLTLAAKQNNKRTNIKFASIKEPIDLQEQIEWQKFPINLILIDPNLNLIMCEESMIMANTIWWWLVKS